MTNTTATEELTRNQLTVLFRGRCLVNPAHAGVTIHEIYPRSQRPKMWMKTENRVLLCNECHDTIHREGSALWITKLTQLRKEWIEKYGSRG